ncbi:protein 60A [Cylas formicarius]|uniref:protein 60A n=1 Tax=Cylas formicarius TaxID=197179 RepID=UPI002958918E|nr:protein 60A [Cylas formicarius]
MNWGLTLVMWLALLPFSRVCCTPKAAIYVDNGMGQTAIDRLMTNVEKLEMESEILNLLGLPNRPRKINKSTVKKSAPKFLLDIYKSLIEEQNEEEGYRRPKRSSDLNLSGNEQQQIYESDIIMTFESVENHVDSVRHERGKRLWFNVLELPVAEDIVGAELRIFQNKSASIKRPESIYTVTAYQLIKTYEGERGLEYISSINTTAEFTGWLSLNITQCLAAWVALPKSNNGLYLSVHPAGKPGHEIRPEDIGLVMVKGDEETQPFMVAFLKASNYARSRTRRELKSRAKKSDFSAILKNGRSIESETWQSCQINTLYISFKDLQWQDWIIAPEGYAAYYCRGECNFPLNAHMNASNHAIVQTLVHLIHPTRYPKSSCAPTKLSPISVLYFLDDHNVVLKKYKQMVVRTCGCR